ncbi:replication initiation and membrane attachment family protein [Paenibacillus curdlanolyticus YK9]|uniref:Replication initiation and membrane attachment family protein n=1 Tax=Paenibacillus curdlanolyticus YK9 TaxID=717606 RepID=E0IFT3_9BACL|nr:DnaD domain protein [Paenibacillus curdlanolyticus]EFM08749.1 replication initiation and membrane attachment family protein [Paenibacillus curdlanolyticus YK9]
MRITHVLQFTEHHRYYTFRGFSLSPLDMRMLSLIYQPMIGTSAISLYQLLYHQVMEGRTGYSAVESHRMLFLALGLEMNERGRKKLLDDTSRLEAVGMLQTSRLAMPDNDDVVYEYELSAPLAPDEFFRNQHLTLLLRDQIGKYSVIALRESFSSKEPDELAEARWHKENISVPFYELFRLNTSNVDDELEQALTEVAPARQPAPQKPLSSETAGLTAGELLMRFPRGAGNRKYVERLRSDADGMAQINYVAYKYNIGAADVCRLLDEDGVFTAQGELLVEELQLRANQLYRQDKKRESDRQRVMAKSQAAARETSDTEDEEEYGVPEELYMEVPKRLEGRCDIHQYNMLMRNEPHTRFLQRYFPGAVPDMIDRTFERIDLNYKLPAAVINVLIHYVIGTNDSQRVTKTFIEAVASNMLLKQVDTFEKAVRYVREQQVIESARGTAGGAVSGSGRGRGRPSGSASRKPAIPIVQEQEQAGGAPSAEKLEELRRLARKLDGK